MDYRSPRRHAEPPIHGLRNGWGAFSRSPFLGLDFTVCQILWRLFGVDHLHVNGIGNKFCKEDDSVVASARASLKPVLVNADADDRAMPVFSSAQTARQAEATYEAIKSVDLIYACGGGITDAARLDRLGAVALQKWPHLGSERGILLAMRGPKPALSAGAVSFRCTRSTSRNERIHCAGRL